MYETNSSFRRFRKHVFWKTRDIIRERIHRIDHHAFSRSRVRAFSFERNRSGSRAPGLVADLTQFLAVDRVGELRSKLFDVKLVDPTSNLFIWSEGYGNRSVFDLGVLDKVIDHRHYLGAAGFVVRSKQCSSVGGDDIVSDQVLEIGIPGDGDDLRSVFWKDDVAALIVLVNYRVDVFIGDRVRRIHG